MSIVSSSDKLVPVANGPSHQPRVNCTIGMLLGWPLSRLFLEACHQTALSKGARFFYFYPQGVDIDNRQILGSHWKDGVWTKAIFPFPDVVYDRMRRKGEKFAWLYDALSAIPITHLEPFGKFNKIKVYRAVGSDEKLSAAVIPFETLNDPKQVEAFVDRHPKLILKPVRGSHGQRIITVTKAKRHYEVFDQTFVHTMSRKDFDKLLAMLGKSQYFAQQFIDSKTKEGYPFHVRVHLMKNGSGAWRIAFVFPSFSLTPYSKITNHENTFRGITKWEWFVHSQYGEELKGDTDRKIRAFAYRTARLLENRLGGGFHEIGLDLGIDGDGTVKLFEANLGNVGMNFHEFQVAKYGIDYAIFVASGLRASRFDPIQSRG